MTATTHTNALRGMLYGLSIGDALAMPVHWYYSRDALHADYGRVKDFLTPRNPHPDSILWRSHYRALNARGEILHAQARYWGRRNVHYHQFLEAGENTLNVKLAGLLTALLSTNGGYDPDDFLAGYIDFMTTPGRHRDTYIEECHRQFFTNYARGRPAKSCGAPEKHIGGLVGIIPLIGFLARFPDQAREASQTHLALTHPGPRMAIAGSLLTNLLLGIMDRKPLEDVLWAAIDRQENPLLGHPFRRWLEMSDETVIGRELSPACYVEDAVPAVVYLALKYWRDPEEGLIVNTNLGGDNAGRGAVLGALLGAAGGMQAFPQRWIDGLRNPPPDLRPR